MIKIHIKSHGKYGKYTLQGLFQITTNVQRTRNIICTYLYSYQQQVVLVGSNPLKVKRKCFFRLIFLPSPLPRWNIRSRNDRMYGQKSSLYKIYPLRLQEKSVLIIVCVFCTTINHFSQVTRQNLVIYLYVYMVYVYSLFDVNVNRCIVEFCRVHREFYSDYQLCFRNLY